MSTTSRDRISVDLRGLRSALFDRARTNRVSPSNLVRSALAHALAVPDLTNFERQPNGTSTASGDRVRLTLRMTRRHAMACMQAARCAGMNPGDFVAGLMDGVPVLAAAGSRPDLIAALVASSAELSTLSRNIHHLTALLRQSAFRAAQEYRPMLDTLGTDVRAHLALTSRALAELQPKGGRAHPAMPTND